MATDCEDIAREMDEKFLNNPGIYFRFNVEHGLQNIGLEEWMELGNIKAKTVAYLQDPREDRKTTEAATALNNNDTSRECALSTIGI